MKAHHIKPALRLLAALVVLLTAHHALADASWTGGGGSTNWTDNNNWGGTNVYTNYGTLTFNTGGSQGTTSVVNSNINQNKLLWTGSSSWTINNSSGAGISLFDNGGTQSKVENSSSGLVTLNVPITFANNNAVNPWGEINAINGNITYASGTLTVNGSQVNGIRLFGSNRTTTFNNTVSASGKWFGLTGTTTTMAIGGAFTSGDIYVMNNGTLQVSSGASVTTSAVRLGGDFGNTGLQNQTQSGTLQFTNTSGGQSFSSVINSVSGNTSNALLIDSLNTSNSNTISSSVFLDSALKTQVASGGTLLYQGGSVDVKAQTFTVAGTGNTTINEALSSSLAAGGSLIKSGSGTLILQGTSNNYTGTNSSTLNANGTQISGGTLGIYAATSLGLAPAGAYNNIQFTGSGTLQDTSSNITLGTTRNISVASGATATFDSNGNSFQLDGIINGTGGSVAKSGTGTLTVTGVNTYSGGTAINNGTLLVKNTSGTTGLGSGAVSVNSGGTLSGTGNASGSTVAVNSGGKISAGSASAIGALTTGAQTWNGGGAYAFKVNVNDPGSQATAGVKSDELIMSGLNLASSSGTPFTIAITSLLGAAGTAFNGTQNYSWIIAHSTGAITGNAFNTNLFTLDTSSFHASNYADSSNNTSSSGTFGISQSGSDVVVSYTSAAPEPTTVLLFGVPAMVLLAGRRSRGRGGEESGHPA